MEGKSFVYFERLKLPDIIITTVCFVYSIIIFLVYYLGSYETAFNLSAMHIFLSQLGAFVFMFTLLRNFTFYLIWIGFAVLHFVMYYLFSSNHKFEIERANTFLNTIILLVVFQMLRYLSLKIQKREFRVPQRNKVGISKLT